MRDGHIAATRRNTVYSGSWYSYQSEGRCRVCAMLGQGTEPQPTISIGSGIASSLPVCRLHYEEAVRAFDDIAIRFGLGPTGTPTIDPPPFVETWVVERGSRARLGTARFARLATPEELEVHELYIFASTTDPRVDLLIQQWASEWTPRDASGRHHICRALPPKLMLEDRYRFRIPEDVPDGVFRVRVEQPE